MPTPEQGRIILARVVDPQSRNPKVRPVVIVTPTEEIDEAAAFYGVAITSTLPNPLPDELVLIPFQRNGRGRTRLKKRSAAKCDWLVEVRHGDIEGYLGAVPGNVLNQIKEQVRSLP